MGSPGRRHDQIAFQTGFNFNALPLNQVLLADGGYVGIEGLSWPFKKPKNGALSQEQEAWNQSHAYLRSTVEHVFGDLEARFQVLRYPRRIHYRIQPLVTQTVYQLYNFVASKTGFRADQKLAFLDLVAQGEISDTELEALEGDATGYDDDGFPTGA